MTNSNESRRSDDPYNLTRFVQAQADDYEQALSEIRSGKKRTHWMWYIFPQFDGLGYSPTSKHYSIKSIAEADEPLAVGHDRDVAGIDDDATGTRDRRWSRWGALSGNDDSRILVLPDLPGKADGVFHWQSPPGRQSGPIERTGES